MLFKQRLLAEYKNRHDKIMKGFASEYSILVPRGSLSAPDPSTCPGLCLNTSISSNTSSNIDKTRTSEGEEQVAYPTEVFPASATAKMPRRSASRKSLANLINMSAITREKNTLESTASKNPLQSGQPKNSLGTKNCVEQDSQALSGNNEYREGEAKKEDPFPKSCAVRVDETMIPDESQIQDYSYFIGDQTQTIDALNGSRRRRATRKTGRRREKRPNSPCLEFPDIFKKQKTDQVENFLIEYHRELKNSRFGKKSEKIASEVKKEYRDKWKSRVKKAEKEALNLKAEMERELEAVRKVKEELQLMEKKKRDDDEVLRQRLALEAEENRRLKNEREEDRKRLEEYQKLLDAEMKCKSEKEQKNSMDRTKTRTIAAEVESAFESKIFVERQMNAKPSDISSFFATARKEHIERVNQTIISRTILNDASDSAKQKVTFNNTPHAPQHPVFKMTEIRPQDLYKRTIDAQNAEAGPKDYIPKVVIPLYESEDEFLTKEKKFEHATFTKDPSLWCNVRNQSHKEIRRFFGSQADINVAEIFSHVKNASNFSPNKLVRRERKG